MPRLDDAGMHRPDRDLVQAFALHRQERIGGRRLAVIEPRPRVGQADRLQPIQVARGPLQPQRRRVHAAERRESAVGAVAREMNDCRAVEQGQVRAPRLTPQAQQRGGPRSQASAGFLPPAHPSSAATCWNHATSGAGR